MSYCNWDRTSAVNAKYHDEEWGVPLHDDKRQFEYLSLEVMQCGLSWTAYTLQDVERIMKTEGMIKSRRKIEAIVNNAKCFQKVREEFGSFDTYLWGYSGNKTILYDKHAKGYIPASNGLSLKISQDLKKRGFKFLGPVVMYSHMQACGMINDHDENCLRYQYINNHYPTVCKRRDNEAGVLCFNK